ncbi:hypothetical protein LOTGIDRAFT_171804 [Lottia gigantea]|uniref:C2 domain-containing protein n=1 Tax=Lottia gigantea TaxID=225164 RepID=V4AYM6_LOTGI|nr:hypothetical protein LOTGIDRAFT_171804 [Lottia gigantea]ESP02733.1 hypothetical protein LOTGIDRAFT_171804 [Lottia gigantea]
MDIFQQMKQKASQDFSDFKQVADQIGSIFQDSLDFSRAIAISIRSPNLNRNEAMKRKTASYDEYYSKQSNRRAEALRQKEENFPRLINKFDRLRLNLTPKQIIERSDPQSPQLYHRTVNNPNFTTDNIDISEKTFGRRLLTSIDSDDSGFEENSMFEEYLFPKHRDSIADVDLGTDQVQITINHEHKNNLLCVSLHRARLTFPKHGRIFTKLCILPNKLQKRRGKLIAIANTKKWEEDFVFTKLSIGELETCSIQIRIYEEKGFMKRPLLKYETVVAFKDVDLTNFQTTILPLKTMTNQLSSLSRQHQSHYVVHNLGDN